MEGQVSNFIYIQLFVNSKNTNDKILLLHDETVSTIYRTYLGRFFIQS